MLLRPSINQGGQAAATILPVVAFARLAGSSQRRTAAGVRARRTILRARADMPLISLVMAARNAAPFIRSALASVPARPSGATCEILLADGESTDGTLAIAQQDPRVRIVSRADTGIYDGMNRAIAAARGDLTLILNSDDLLVPEAFSAAVERMLGAPALDHVSGGALFGTAPEQAFARRHRSELTMEGALFGVPAINSRLFRTDCLRGVGPILTEAGLGADREWMMRLARAGARSATLPDPFYFYRSHTGSQTLAGGLVGRRRVYEAEARITAVALGSSDLAPGDRALLRAAAALAAAKRGLAGTPSKSDAVRTGPIDLLRGLALGLKWRGRLSGF